MAQGAERRQKKEDRKDEKGAESAVEGLGDWGGERRRRKCALRTSHLFGEGTHGSREGAGEVVGVLYRGADVVWRREPGAELGGDAAARAVSVRGGSARGERGAAGLS